LGGETLVARDVEVCTARNLVFGDALARFHVPQDAYIRSGRHACKPEILSEVTGLACKQATTADFPPSNTSNSESNN
jgi:hypothetical protein